MTATATGKLRRTKAAFITGFFGWVTPRRFSRVSARPFVALALRVANSPVDLNKESYNQALNYTVKSLYV